MCIVLSTHAVASNSASILVMKCHFRETLKLAPVESFHVLRKCIDVNSVLKSTTEDYKAKELGSQTDMQNVNPFRTAMQLRKRLNKKNCKILRQIIADKVNIVILVLVRIRVEETPRRIFKFPLLFWEMCWIRKGNETASPFHKFPNLWASIYLGKLGCLNVHMKIRTL